MPELHSQGAGGRDPGNETVKYEEIQPNELQGSSAVLPRSRSFAEAAKKKARELGYSPMILANDMNVHAADLGSVLGAMLNCGGTEGRGITPPVAFVLFGRDDSGRPCKPLA
jgi:glycerate-2-kinase